MIETTTIILNDENSISIKYVLDHCRSIVHVFDVGTGSVDVQSGMNNIQDYFINTSKLGISMEWSWFLYKRNGSVNNYIDGNFYYIPLTDQRVYPAFIGAMLIRTNKKMYAL
jgi:hypothetical protein